MSDLKATHELHGRRFSRNLGVGLTLTFLVAVVFGLTVVKVQRGELNEGFDHVAPYSAGAYFSKIQCFCFEMQVLEPGETVSMPVSFFVEPEILDDPDARFVKTITLSYTFHEVDLPEDYAPEQAALTEDGGVPSLN